MTEQGASASHMTAAKVLGTISRLPGVAAQASDDISAYTQSTVSTPPNYWRFQRRNALSVWIRLPQNRPPKTLGYISRPRGPIGTQPTRPPAGRLTLGKAIRTHAVAKRVGGSSKLELYLLSSKILHGSYPYTSMTVKWPREKTGRNVGNIEGKC